MKVCILSTTCTSLTHIPLIITIKSYLIRKWILRVHWLIPVHPNDTDRNHKLYKHVNCILSFTLQSAPKSFISSQCCYPTKCWICWCPLEWLRLAPHNPPQTSMTPTESRTGELLTDLLDEQVRVELQNQQAIAGSTSQQRCWALQPQNYYRPYQVRYKEFIGVGTRIRLEGPAHEARAIFDHTHISFEPHPFSHQRGCVKVRQEVSWAVERAVSQVEHTI